jgi:cell division transport system permease protein
MRLGLVDRWFRRAFLGLRREAALHVGAAASLAAAFVLLGLVALLFWNLARSVDAWSGDVQLTAYLRDGASAEEAAYVTAFAGKLRGVTAARVVSAEEARARLASPGSPGARAFAELPAELYPVTVEVVLAPEARAGARPMNIAERLRALPFVDEVDSVPELAARLENVLAFARLAGIVVAVVVLLGGLSIVSSTLLVSLQRRREEVELLRLCGATDGFLRIPLLIEGALQALAGACLALALLGGTYLAVRGVAADVLATLGIQPSFLPLPALAAALAAAALLGAAGSEISFRRAVRV